MSLRRGAIVHAMAALLVVGGMVACTPEPGGLIPGDSGSPAGSTPRTTQPPVALHSLGSETPLPPGQYLALVDGQAGHPLVPVFTVPEGWSNLDDGGGIVDWGEDVDRLGRVVWVWDIDEVWTHPCAEGGHPEAVGPSVGDLADALAAQPLRDAPAPEPVTIGGYDGLFVRLSVPEGTDVDACPGGRFNSWPGRWQQIGGQIDMLWILDVEGDRIVIAAAHGPDVSPEDVDEMTEIVTSATFRSPRLA